MRESCVIGGRYVLGDVLGAGGMSVVHRAQDLKLGTEVAVKVLASNLAHDPTVGSRFAAEAEHLGEVSHPNLVRILDVGRDRDARYLVMELVDGETLEQRLRRDDPLTLADVARIVTHVASGLAALHDRGLVHRDVKPANILIGRDEVAKLGDFGLVRGVPMGVTLPGTAMGTLSYLAPELLRGEDAKPASDRWALGAVAYRALTGALPYPATTVTALVQQQAHPPVPPSIVDPALPPEVDAAVLAALGPPDGRPKPVDFGAALRAVASGAPCPIGGDWADDRTSVIDLATVTPGTAPSAWGSRPDSSRRARFLARLPHPSARTATLVAAGMLAVAVVTAAGTPQGSLHPVTGSLDAVPRDLVLAPNPTPARTAAEPDAQHAPQQHVIQPPVTEAARHSTVSSGHGPPHGGSPPGHGKAPRRGTPRGHAGGPGHGGPSHGQGHGHRGGGQDRNQSD